jgi:ankyrin repeat protein
MIFPRLFFACVLALALSNCRKKSDAAAKEIVEAGYAMTAEGWFSAVRGNDVAVMKKMADGGFDGKTKDAEGNGALHLAAAAGAKEAGDYLLNRGFSIDEKGGEGRTPLMAAVMADKPEMVRWLLRQGADPKPKDDNGFMALMLAVNQGGQASVEELAPYHREDLDSALLLAALVGKAEVIDALTNYGASVYARMEDGRTPLMLAAQNGHKEAAEMLIDIGASRFATTESGDTAQSLAVAEGHADLAEMIEKGFSGDTLALESDEEVAEAMDEYLAESQVEPEEPAEEGALAANDGGGEKMPWNTPVPGQGGGQFGLLPDEAAGPGTPRDLQPAGNALSGDQPAVTAKTIEGARIGKREPGAAQGVLKDETEDDLPLVMRHYRQRELPVEVKQVSGGVASLHIVGSPAKNLQVKAGETIPGSSLSVIRVFSRTEEGKLNDGAPVEVGIVEVEDTGSGRRMEWIEGRPAVGHDPVALVEDAATGRRYVAKPGQKFASEDGREFIVNDVRPGQIVIEETASGEVRTLRLRGPKG